MTVNAIQKNEYTSQKMSYLKSALIGGLSGYALKYALPITQHEKDERYSFYLEQLKNQVRESKLKTIEAIRNSQPKTLETDNFIRLVDKKEVKISKIKALESPLSSQVGEIVNLVNDKGREVRAYGKETLKALTKHIRPTKTFVATGAGIAITTAFIYNTIVKLADTN